MKRLLMFVGVAAVAGAMYVAAASGSQQSAGPTAKQFKALQSRVTALSKQVKRTTNNLNELAFIYIHCSLPSEIGIDQRGGPGFGYSYTPDGVDSTFTTALDLTTSANPAYAITPFNAADSGCQSLVGLALRQNAGSLLAQKFARTH